MSDDLGQMAARARARMVEQVAANGAVSGAVLEAMGRVPRHVFADRFWAPPRDARLPYRGRLAAWRIDAEHPDPAAVDLVHAPERAWPLHDVEDWPRGVRATISAPDLMASMLTLLDLRPGLRVLEVGTGSGYNAALLAEVVGDPALVTTIEMDPTLAASARDHLSDVGYGGVTVLVGDGHVGAAGPFDRVVATVGCHDLSPHWHSQLDPPGFALVPVLHAGLHPLVRARPEPDGPGWLGELTGRSGFVDVQGYQDRAGPWPSEPLGTAADRTAWAPVARPVPATRRFDLGYFIGLCDDRASRVGLAGADGSGAELDAGGDRIVYSGPSGAKLVGRMTELAEEWWGIGAPALEQYRTSWTPLEPSRSNSLDRVDARRWRIARIDYDQEIVLP